MSDLRKRISDYLYRAGVSPNSCPAAADAILPLIEAAQGMIKPDLTIEGSWHQIWVRSEDEHAVKAALAKLTGE